ncbi:MAG TPA: GFA family protein [Candidatus Polarisedimenticolaceae bacterium]|nr:GFA family protein [Candidatus Polarisedimenticolaceae bacterium]
MSQPLEGGCACGDVRYRVAGAPLFVHCCHCRNCQRHTGSAFVINLLIEAACVELLQGDPAPTVMPLNGGSPNTIFRCPRCAVAVWSEYGGRSEVRFVRAGTLDDPSAIAPDVHIYTRSKLPWVRLDESVPAFAEYYDPAKLWPAASLERRAALRRG